MKERKKPNTDGMKEGSRQYNDQLVRIERSNLNGN